MKNKIPTLLIAVMCLLIAPVLCGCQSENAGNNVPVAQQTVQSELIQDITTVQAFTAEAVSDADINAIVMAGVNAPSAMNSQPWHFSVITDPETLAELGGGMSFGGMAGGTPPAGFEMPENMDLPEGMEPPEGMEMPEGMPEGMPEKPDMNAASFSGAKAGIGDAPLAIVISCREGSELDAGLATQNMSAEAQLLGYGTKIISSPKMTLNQDTYREILGVPADMSAVCVLLVGKTDTENYDVTSGATTRNPMDETVTYIK